MNITPIEGVAGGFQCTLEGSPAAEAVEEGLKGLPEGAKYASIVLTDVRFLNSRAINLIVELAQKLKAGGGASVLVGVSSKLKLTLENLGVEEYFEFDENDADARNTLASLASGK